MAITLKSKDSKVPDFKIVNKLIILHSVATVNENLICFRFRSEGNFDYDHNLFELEVEGTKISQYHDRISDSCLNISIVITADSPNELMFHIGEFDQAEDWNTEMILPFEKFTTRFIYKTIADWKTQYICLIKDIARTISYQEATSSPDRLTIMHRLAAHKMDQSKLSEEILYELDLMRTKIEGLNDETFYNIFLLNSDFGML